MPGAEPPDVHDDAESSAMNGHGFVLTRPQKILTALKYYCYSSMEISKREFESPFFIAMLQTVAGPKVTVPVFTQELLEMYIAAEFKLMIRFIKFIMKEKMVELKGNAFAQGIHDGGTLKNR